MSTDFSGLWDVQNLAGVRRTRTTRRFDPWRSARRARQRHDDGDRGGRGRNRAHDCAGSAVERTGARRTIVVAGRAIVFERHDAARIDREARHNRDHDEQRREQANENGRESSSYGAPRRPHEWKASTPMQRLTWGTPSRGRPVTPLFSRVRSHLGSFALVPLPACESSSVSRPVTPSSRPSSRRSWRSARSAASLPTNSARALNRAATRARPVVIPARRAATRTGKPQSSGAAWPLARRSSTLG